MAMFSNFGHIMHACTMSEKAMQRQLCKENVGDWHNTCIRIVIGSFALINMFRPRFVEVYCGTWKIYL